MSAGQGGEYLCRIASLWQDQVNSPPMPSSTLPQWTTEITDNIVPGEDMLGVEGAAQGYQQWLIPGIITQTNRARYYSFYAWVLHRFIHSTQGNRLIRNFRGKYYKRHEVALILASYAHHMEGILLRNLVGAGNNYNKVRTWWETSDPMSLDVSYFKDSLGGFGQYYLGAMQAMRIVDYSQNPSWVYPLTQRGEALALAYEKSISKTNYFKLLKDEDQIDALRRRDAIGLGKVGCICPEALSKGSDLPLLHEAFFRFDQTNDEYNNSHIRRRLALAVALDIVRGARGKFERKMLRPALYLGEYRPGLHYQPTSGLEDWSLRWQMVSVRHQYTFALQSLWAAFILQLRQSTAGLSLTEFTQWAKNVTGAKSFDASFSDYLGLRCKAVGLSANWQKSHARFSSACLQSSEMDEYSLFVEANHNYSDPEVLLKVGIQSLVQHYLRFLHTYQNPTQEWNEMANRERLSINSFYEAVEKALSTNVSVGQWLETIYKDFILGQHEFIALEKLRYQRYDTFKFYFREGRFYWPFSQANYWREKIRLAGNRLTNALSILIDLGLIQEDDKSHLSLTKLGKEYLARCIQLRKHGN